MTSELIFIKTLLPVNYIAEMKYNGIFCYSRNGWGMSDQDWDKLITAVKVKFGKRFTDFMYPEVLQKEFIKSRIQFTIYLKP